MQLINHHQLITGFLHPDLEQRLLTDIQHIKTADPLEPVVVLVGARGLRENLRTLIAEKLGGIFALRILTFNDFVQTGYALHDFSQPAPPFGLNYIAAVKAALNHSSDSFGGFNTHPSFLRSLARVMAELDEAGIGELGGDIVASRASIRAKKRLEGLINLRREYRSLTGRYLFPPLRMFARGTEADDTSFAVFKTLLEGCTRINVYGIYDFTAFQWQLIERLAGFIPISFYMPLWQPENDWGSAFQYALAGYSLVKGLGGVEEISLTSNEFHFGSRLFHYGAMDIPGDWNRPVVLEVIAAPSERGEVKAVVGRIVELAFYESVPFHRIGVLAWRDNGMVDMLCATLDSAEIPYEDYIGQALAQSLAGRTIRELIHLAGGPIGRAELAHLISAPIVKLSTQTGDEADGYEWETLTLEIGIVEAPPDQWLDAIEDKIRRLINYQDPRVESLMAFYNFCIRLFNALDRIRAAKSWKDWLAAVKAAFEELTFAPLLSDTKDKFDAADSPPVRINTLDNANHLESEAYSRLNSLLVDLIAGEDVLSPVGASLYASMFEQIISGIKISRATSRRGGVLLVDKMNARGIGFHTLIFIGFNYGEVPVRYAESALMPDYYKQWLNERRENAGRLPTGESRDQEERLLLALTADSARNLILTYTCWDADSGREMPPSRFLLELCRAVSGNSVDSQSLPGLPYFCMTDADGIPIHGRDPLAIARRTASISQVPAILLKRLGVKPVSAEDWSRVLERAIRDIDRVLGCALARRDLNRFTEWDGVVGDEFGVALGAETPLAVTELEAYITCPFQYFIRYVLGADELPEPEQLDDIPSRIIGSIVHRTLHRLFKNVNDQFDKVGWTVEKLIKQSEEILIQQIEYQSRRFTAPRMVWRMAQRTLAPRLARFIARTAATSPIRNFRQGEYAVASRLPGVRVKAGAELQLKGRIDRIDVTEDGGVYIIDYKTGRTVNDPKEFQKFRIIQLPVYLKMELSRNENVPPGASKAAYWQMDDQGELKQKGLTDSELDEIYPALSEWIQSAVNGIEGGFFAPLPEKDKCGYCSVSAACNKFSRDKMEHSRAGLDRRWAGLFNAGIRDE